MNNLLMKRLLGLIQSTFLGCLLLAPYQAWGVSLGRLSLNSALNQSLDATIEISNVQGLTSEEIRVGLAPKESFEALNVRWTYSLDNIALRAEPSAQGILVILTSREPIVEPYLNFVVEVLWPKGRVVREYTALLDPPVLAAPGLVAPTRDQPRESKQEAPATVSQTSMPAENRYWTQAGDTLWEIALMARPNRSVSVQEMMLLIQRLNPDAFLDANINRLKAGFTLEMPSEAAFSLINTEEAVAEVAEQNRALDQDQPPKKKADTPDEAFESASTPVSDSQLVILADDDPLPAESLEQDISATAVETALMNAEAQATQALEENAMLQSRLSAFEAQLADLASAVTVKDEQIVRLQRQLASLERPAQPVGENPILAPMTLALLALVMVLVVAVLLVSARLRRVSRNLKLTSSGSQNLASGSASEPEHQSPGAGVVKQALTEPPSTADQIQQVSGAEGASAGSEAEAEPQISRKDDKDHVGPQDESASSGEDILAGTGPEEEDTSSLAQDTENRADSAYARRDETLSASEELEDLNELEDLEAFEELGDLGDLEELDLSESDDVLSLTEVETNSVPQSNPQIVARDELDPDEDPSSMLDLARAYIEMEHVEEAKKLLQRVTLIGLPHEVADAEQMLASLSD